MCLKDLSQVGIFEILGFKLSSVKLKIIQMVLILKEQPGENWKYLFFCLAHNMFIILVPLQMFNG